MPAPTIIHQLVARFEENREAYRSGKYNEAQLREEFLNPFFKALGWDMYNDKGYSPEYREVVHEDSIDIEGASKAPDYSFKIGKERKFFVEAKKPRVDIEYDIHPAYQLRRYAWNTHLPLSILTDFEEFAVYDCRNRPNPTDKASTGRTLFFNYKEYVEKWDVIAGLFSPEAIQKGSFEKYAIENKGKKGTSEVDDAFLEDIENWRKMLALNIALRNTHIADEREVNFAVQITIDRIIFLRICEDRGIEPAEQLLTVSKKTGIYTELMRLFESADRKYNSGLFHFKAESKGDSGVDTLTPTLVIDDKVLKEIIKSIYYPCPYIFKEIPVEILGQVYEQFLGKVIRLTAGRQAKVEEKPEVRKAGGVYYTPSYIVDYIVQNTVGKLLEDKTPATAASLKIVDPACGSGSFLLGAFQYLIDWHEQWYLANGAEKWAKGKSPALVATSGIGWKLTTTEKKKILLNNIHGVDIDAQAVEVTKLSLLLKVLEEETGQLSLGLERALPDLGKNIQCGNSLIGEDYFEGRLVVDEEERRRVNPFDWHAAFPDVFKQGGFDAVIGNPPWGVSFSDSDLLHLRKKYRDVISRMIDSYIYFFKRAIQLNNFQGVVGFIVPSTILNQIDAAPIRNILLEKKISHLYSLGEGVFGTNVLNTSSIIICGDFLAKNEITINDLTMIPAEKKQYFLENGRVMKWNEWLSFVKSQPSHPFFASHIEEGILIQKIKTTNIEFREILNGEIQRGVSPDIASAHIISPKNEYSIEPQLLRKSISGKQIKRYKQPIWDQYILYTSKSTKISEFSKSETHLSKYKTANKCKEVADGKHPWFSLHRPRNPNIFNSPKFIGLTTTKSIELIYDDKNNFIVTDAMYLFSIKENYDPLVCMGVLLSKAFLFFYRTMNLGDSRVIPQIKAIRLYDLPFPDLGKKNQEDINLLHNLVNKMLSLHEYNPRTPPGKESLQHQIAATDRQIDALVYELYGLTEEEIKIVECSEE